MAKRSARLIDHIDERPEHRLLIACAVLPLPPNRIEQARSLCQQAIDWEYLIRVADEHGMLWVLFTQIDAHLVDWVPPCITSALRTRFEQHKFKNLWSTSELQRLLACLTKQGVQVAPFKGPVLAEPLYGNLAVRYFGDLDLLIHPKDYWAVHRLLLAEGYQANTLFSEVETTAFVRYQCERTFVHRGYGITIDLHWGVWLSHDILFLDRVTFWQRLHPTTLAGKPISVLSPEDTLLLLAIHGTMHHWRGLSWLMDIGQLLRVSNEIDWGWVMQEASRLGIRRIVLLALQLASELMGVNLPSSISKAIERDVQVASLAEQICAELFLPRREVPIFEDMPFHLRSRENLIDRMRCLVTLATAPSVEEITLLRLPKWLFPVYRILRPIRLTTKYVGAIRQKPESELK